MATATAVGGEAGFVDKSKWVSMRQAARAIGVTSHALSKLVMAGTIGVIFPAGSTPRCNAEDVARLAAGRADN